MIRIYAIFFYFVIRLLRITSKVKQDGADHLLNSPNEKFILTFWHRDLVLMMAFWNIAPIHAISTLSRRGKILQSVITRLGHAVTLVPEGDPYVYMRSISEVLKKAAFPVVIVADGPLGPPLLLKPTILKFAEKHQRSILPLRIKTNHYKEIINRWDKLRIPMCFSRVQLTIGEPIRLFNKEGQKRSVEGLQKELIHALNVAYLSGE